MLGSEGILTPQAVLFDIGNVLIESQPARFYDRVDRGETFRDVIVEIATATPDRQDEIIFCHDRWLDMAGLAIDRSARFLATEHAQ